jgi:hypothetical protein
MISRNRVWIAGVALAACMVAAAPVAASVFLKVDIPGLTRMSTAVVHAQVTEVRSAWNDEKTFIFTYVTLRVDETFRGEATETVVVRVPGGKVGDYVVEMEGAPRFRTGDEVVVFLGRWDDGAPMVAGYAQGVSRVQKDALGNRFLRGGIAEGMTISDLGRAVGRVGR